MPDYNKLVEHLNKARQYCIDVLLTTAHGVELIILTVIVDNIRAKCHDDEDVIAVADYMDTIMKLYPKDPPHDTCLFALVEKNYPGIEMINRDNFDKKKLAYRIFNRMSQDEIINALSCVTDKREIAIVSKLGRIISGALVDDPNLNSRDGGEPYYKRYPHDMDSKSKIDFVNKEFDSYIDYFKEVV